MGQEIRYAVAKSKFGKSIYPGGLSSGFYL